MRALAFLPLVVAMLAGCVDPAVDPVDAPDRFTNPDNPIPEEDGGAHDHRDPLQHLFAENATYLDHEDLKRFGWSEEQPVGAHAVDIAGNLLAVAVHGAETDEGQNGVHLIDISDPANMTHLSFWSAGVPVNGDRTVAFSGDGQTLFLGFEGGAANGVQALDIRNPNAPVPVAFWDDPQDFGSHTIAAGIIDGEQYVFSLAAGVNILRYDESGFTLVGKYVTADELAAAEAWRYVVGDEQGNPQTYALRAVYGHDMNFYLDPETGLPLLLVAYAYDGAKILDLSQPSAPVLLGRFLPPKDTEHSHYTHSITAERMATGELIVVVGSETFEPSNQGIPSPIWILDATQTVAEPPMTAQPIHVGTWSNPGGAPAGDLGLSVHFFRQEDGLLYISHYHGGVWGVDLRTPEARAQPTHFAYMMPVPEDPVLPPEECCIGFDLDGVPMVFDLAVDDGIVYAADLLQGVVSLEMQRP